MSMSIIHIIINDLGTLLVWVLPWIMLMYKECIELSFPTPTGCGTMERWIHSLFVAALLRVGPAPSLRTTIDLELVV